LSATLPVTEARRSTTLVILTTNFRQNVDAAFVRRLRFSIDFPLPDAEERLKIWEGAFPDSVPRAANLDLAFLARRFQLTGGHIQQIALSAAFLAAETCQIEMHHVVLATRQQLTKLGMTSAEKGLVESVKVHGVPSA
jgi:SpoVK/Ycf46/Vps4 family AAA+-type ATPase